MPSTVSPLSSMVPSTRCSALPICPNRIFGPCVTVAMSFYPQRRAALRRNDRLLDVLHILVQADDLHIDFFVTSADDARRLLSRR